MAATGEQPEPDLALIRIEALARIAYGRRLMESGEEILRLLDLLTDASDRPPLGQESDRPLSGG